MRGLGAEALAGGGILEGHNDVPLTEHSRHRLAWLGTAAIYAVLPVGDEACGGRWLATRREGVTAAAADALKEERLHGHKERAAHWHALAADAPFDELSVVPIERAPSERKIAQREASLEGEHANAQAITEEHMEMLMNVNPDEVLWMKVKETR